MKKNKTYILFFIFFILIENIYTQNLKDLFQTANVYYKNKQYEEAEKLYLLILNKDKNNVNVYYNLGNTYFHLKQFPQSILYYEKAKKLQSFLFLKKLKDLHTQNLLHRGVSI